MYDAPKDFFFEYFLIDWQMWRTRREARFTGVRKHEVVMWLLISTEMGTLSAVCQKVQLKYFLSSLCLEIQKTYKLRAVTMLYWFAACVAWYTDTRNKQKDFQFHDQTQERGDKWVTGTFLHKLLSLLPLSPASQWPICWPTDMVVWDVPPSNLWKLKVKLRKRCSQHATVFPFPFPCISSVWGK